MHVTFMPLEFAELPDHHSQRAKRVVSVSLCWFTIHSRTLRIYDIPDFQVFEA